MISNICDDAVKNHENHCIKSNVFWIEYTGRENMNISIYTSRNNPREIQCHVIGKKEITRHKDDVYEYSMSEIMTVNLQSDKD